MKINENKNLTLPKRNQELYRKIDFINLFDKEFEQVKVLEINEELLQESTNETNYDDILFSLTKNYSNKEYILELNENCDKPIVLVYKLQEDSTLFTNLVKIKVAKDVKASLIEVFTNSCKNSGFLVNREYILEENAQLEYARVQHIHKTNSLIFNANFTQKDNSKIKFTSIEKGTGFIVNNFINVINDKNVEFYINSLVKSKRGANTTNLVRTYHNNKASTSDINFKHSLKDDSKAILKATTYVNKKAFDTKAFQNSNSVLLSNDAVIYAQPHLEILIDELEASHGATTGSLDKDQLLYLKSRGISEEKAYDMLLKAFEIQVYNNVENENIKEFLYNYSRDNYV